MRESDEEFTPLPEDPRKFPNSPERRKHIRTMKKDLEFLLRSPGRGEEKNENLVPPVEVLPPASQEQAKLIKKRILFIVGGLLLLVLVGVGAYVWFVQKKAPSSSGIEKEQPEKTTEEPPIRISPAEPAPLVPINETDTVVLGNIKDLPQEIEKILDKNYPPKSVRRILGLKKEDNVFLTFGEFLNTLNLTLPPILLSQLEDTYTFGVYSGPTGINSLILVTEFKPERSYQTIREELGIWELTMEDDLGSLLTPTERKRERASPQFLDNTYNQTLIRYLNFSDPTITLDYAIFPEQKLFIITTSRESMFAIIDVIREVSPNTL